MSANDPTDDELEREARNDIPLPMGGTGRHAPRLGTESRAINPRAVLMAEADAQSAPGPNMAAYQAQRQAQPWEGAIDRTFERPIPGVRQSLVAPLPSRLEPPPPPAPARANPLEHAWDEYAAHALAAYIAYAPNAEPGQLAHFAAAAADALIAERKARFR